LLIQVILSQRATRDLPRVPFRTSTLRLRANLPPQNLTPLQLRLLVQALTTKVLRKRRKDSLHSILGLKHLKHRNRHHLQNLHPLHKPVRPKVPLLQPPTTRRLRKRRSAWNAKKGNACYVLAVLLILVTMPRRIKGMICHHTKISSMPLWYS
jgi:hypothetical protein